MKARLIATLGAAAGALGLLVASPVLLLLLVCCGVTSGYDAAYRAYHRQRWQRINREAERAYTNARNRNGDRA